MNKKIIVSIISVVLVAGMVSVPEVNAQELVFINIDVSNTPNTEDFPFGIDCTDPNFVYVTLFEQGLLAKINKATRAVEPLIDNQPPGAGFDFGEAFYAIARVPNEDANNNGILDTGEDANNNGILDSFLFVNTRISATAWRFNTGSSTWDSFELEEGGGDITSQGVVFANNFVWITLTDVTTGFSGVVRVEPNMLEVTQFPIDGAGLLASLNTDSVNENVLWIADKGAVDPETGFTVGDKIFSFDISDPNSPQVGEPILIATPDDPDDPTDDDELSDASDPNHIATDENFIYVALNEISLGFDPATGPFSKIAMISRSDGYIQVINTLAPNNLSGTFTVFVPRHPTGEIGDLLLYTDQSGHLGQFDLSNGTPEIIPDEVTGLPFTTTGELDSNHFGCEVVNTFTDDFEFWFASHGSAKVGIQPNSKFSVGGLKKPTGKGGSDAFARTGMAFGDPTRSNYDDDVPTFGEVLTSSGSLVVSAQIYDNVGVKEAKLLLGKSVYVMNPHNGNPVWWDANIPSSDIASSGEVSFTIIAKDFVGNSGEYNGSVEVSAGAAVRTSQPGGSFIITPLASGQPEPYSIIASSMGPIEQDAQLQPQITIKNDSDEPLKNIRLMLSSELKGKFLLSDYAVKSIAPHSEYTISLKLNGKPNVDVMNNPIPYSGRIIISVDNKSPYVLELYGSIPNQSALIQSLFMKMVENKADERYKSFEKPEQRITQDASYEVTLGSGEKKIRSANDELIIRNTGDTALKNLRIMTSSLSDHFIVEQKNIEILPPSSFLKVKLVSKMNDVVPRDIHGELLVVPENGAPVTIPIDIVRKVQDDKNAMYEVRTISGNDAISNTMDGIIIRNNSEEALNNVRVILPQSLSRIFSLSEDSFRTIEPHTEKAIHLQMRGAHDSAVRQIINNYVGDLIIASSDGMKKIIPIDIVWKRIVSEHFMIYARDNTDELTKATQVVNFLERNYGEATKIFGDVNTKTTIYMTSSLDELSMLTDVLAPSTFIYDQDVAFVWSNSEDVNMLALREFSYRTITQDHASYWIKQKISMDKGNWLVDGLSNYVTASIVGERGMIKNQLNSFIAEPSSFVWYGAGRTATTVTPSQYGAAYTLFKFLVDEYGESIIDKTLSNMESAMASNRCDSYEQCVLLKAVYDVQGLNMNDKRHPISFESIVEEWKNYVMEEYGINTERFGISITN